MDPETEVLEPEVVESSAPEGEAVEPEVTEPGPWYEGLDETQVKTALEFHQNVQTEQGAMEAFFQLGRAFGLGVREIEALFYGTPQTPEEPAAPAAPQYHDDDVLTYAQVKELLAQQVAPVQQSIAAQQQAQAEAVARATLDSTLAELGVTDNETRAAVLQMGDRYLGDDLSPANVAKAVKQGHADFVRLVEGELKRRTAAKGEQAARVPKAPAGAPAGAREPEAEPQSVKEAIKRARARLAAASNG